jgi:hypothetical protein
MPGRSVNKDWSLRGIHVERTGCRIGTIVPSLSTGQGYWSCRNARRNAKPGEGAAKISKVAVNYQDHPDGDKRCDKCAQFQPPDACKVVEGSISPQGSCRIFILKLPEITERIA